MTRSLVACLWLAALGCAPASLPALPPSHPASPAAAEAPPRAPSTALEDAPAPPSRTAPPEVGHDHHDH
jgi:hypothetical protein